MYWDKVIVRLMTKFRGRLKVRMSCWDRVRIKVRGRVRVRKCIGIESL